MKAKRLYRIVAEGLLEFITSGQYSVGDRLPAERELAARFNVSRPTMREAVIALEISGHVEVRKGSGVYVVQNESTSTISPDLNVGPFEMTEARMLIESETAGLAASIISDEELEQLALTIEKMQKENDTGVNGELADREFHLIIARATRNSAIVAIIEDLWDLREKSKLTRNMYKWVRLTGVKPSIDEHFAILRALQAKDAVAARTAMRNHLSRVIDTLLLATEIEAVEEVKKQISKDRQRYTQSRRIN